MEQIKIKLWCDVYAAAVRAGNKYPASEANNAVRNFEKQFKDK